MSHSPATNNPGRRWVSVKVVGEWVGLKPQTIYELFYAKKIPGCRIGRTIRIDLKALDLQLEAQAKGK